MLLVARLVELSESGVEVVYVRLVVLLVVRFHDLTADGRLQRAVVVWQRRQTVRSATAATGRQAAYCHCPDSNTQRHSGVEAGQARERHT